MIDIKLLNSAFVNEYFVPKPTICAPIWASQERRLELRDIWGAKFFKDFQPLIPAKTRSARFTVGTFVGMLFHNAAQSSNLNVGRTVSVADSLQGF